MNVDWFWVAIAIFVVAGSIQTAAVSYNNSQIATACINAGSSWDGVKCNAK